MAISDFYAAGMSWAHINNSAIFILPALILVKKIIQK